MRMRGRGEEEPHAGQRRQGSDLDERDDVLDPRPFLDAERVDGRQKHDREDPGDGSAGEVPARHPDADRNGSENVLRREEGNESAQVFAETRRERRDSSRHDDEERSPAEKEPGEGSVGLL